MDHVITGEVQGIGSITGDVSGAGAVSGGISVFDTPPYAGPYDVSASEQAQTLETNGKKMLHDVSVGGIPAGYVGSEVPRKSSSDLSANGATVTAPAGYYEEPASAEVDVGTARTPASEIVANPTISVDENGVVSASISNSKSITPQVTPGYVSEGIAGTVSVSGSKTLQLDTQAAATVTPTESAQTAVGGHKYTLGAVQVDPIPSGYVGSAVPRLAATHYTPSKVAQEIAAGQYLSGAQTVDPIPSNYHDMSGALAWLGVDAELVTTLTLADVKLSATDFDTWSPSTTAKDILATRTAGTFVATDAPNWNYYIVWETTIPEVVYTGSPVNKARPLYLVAVHVNEICRRSSSYANIQSAILNNSINMSAFTASNFLRYYGSTQGSVTYTWGASYGFYAGITAATLSSASVDSPTITAKSPKVTARCSTTYMSTGNAGLIDKDKTIIKQKAYVYKARIPTLMQGLWNRVIALVNEVDA